MPGQGDGVDASTGAEPSIMIGAAHERHAPASREGLVQKPVAAFPAAANRGPLAEPDSGPPEANQHHNRVPHGRWWIAAAIVAVAAGGAIWYGASRPGDVAVVGAPAGTGSDWAGAAAPGV